MLISKISLLSAAISALIIAYDLRRNPQSMKIMDAVWVLTAIWASIFGLIAYYWFGREKEMNMDGMQMNKRPHWQSVTLSTLHCGAGCTLADTIGSVILFFIPTTLFEGWGVNYVLALIVGVYFQYYAIREMSDDSPSQILRQAIKADFLSLTVWKLGMYGYVYLLVYHFKTLEVGSNLSWEFWFAMQQAMLAGFVVALPVNYLLIKLKIKHGM